MRKMKIDGKHYALIEGQREGKAVLHFHEKAWLNEKAHYRWMEVICEIDEKRRNQLRWHHTATHVMHAASRKVLGPHVWQQGAKKTPIMAHLDISHYQSLSNEEEQQIENEANDIVRRCINLKKYVMNNPDAEKEVGFKLDQGGSIPGKELIIVNIKNTC